MSCLSSAKPTARRKTVAWDDSRMCLSTLTAAAFLVACGGGTTDTPPVGNGFAVAAAVVNSATSVNCPNGGIDVNTGLDTDGNGKLDPAEVINTQTVCNGTNGTNGSNALVRMTDEPTGANNCASGGKKVLVGRDTNGNGALEDTEISSTAYVCNGSNGSNGTNGINSLMRITPEGAGAHCAYGGNKLMSGLDTDGNAVLDDAEVNATAYTCNPSPSGLSWVATSDTAVQAQSNKGYIASNPSARVVITLPTNPAVGDVLHVNGAGTGGWQLAQNAGQQIAAQSLGIQAGALWTAHESDRNWQSVASSSDGSKLVAVAYNGQIYTSTDSGVTWTARESARAWNSVASSSDGNKLVAVQYNGRIFTSNDSGVTWTARESARAWNAVASSSDGSKLVAVAYNGQIYTSTDSGATWTARESNRRWDTAASSSDGSKLVAVVDGGQIYTSTDSGLTWTARESVRAWSYVASSGDGSKLVAVTFGGQIYTSTDSGVNWTARESARAWLSVASSSDGIKLVAVGVNSQKIYTSTDSGVTWTARESKRDWKSVASSSDGSKLVVGTNSEQIYTSANTLTPSAVQTTSGTAGTLLGERFGSIALQYIGGGVFNVLSSTGYFELR